MIDNENTGTFSRQVDALDLLGEVVEWLYPQRRGDAEGEMVRLAPFSEDFDAWAARLLQERDQQEAPQAHPRYAAAHAA